MIVKDNVADFTVKDDEVCIEWTIGRITVTESDDLWALLDAWANEKDMNTDDQLTVLIPICDALRTRIWLSAYPDDETVDVQERPRFDALRRELVKAIELIDAIKWSVSPDETK